MKHHPSVYVPFTRIIRGLALPALLSMLTPQLAAAPLGTAFSYQGKLTDSGSAADGSYDFRSAIYDASSDGTQLGPTLTNQAVSVSNGLFTLTLDFGAGVFPGSARWLALAVRPNGGGDFTDLGPRQEILPVPYSLFASNAASLQGALPSAQLSGNYPSVLTFTNAGNRFGGDGSGLMNLNATALASGTVADARLSENVALRSGGNAFTGNQTITSGSVGIGTGTPGKALHVVGDGQFDKNDGRIVLRTPTRNDPGRYGITFSNNVLGLFLGDDTQPQTFGFYSAFSANRTNDASISIFGKATASWGKNLSLTHNGTNGIVSTDSGHLLLSPAQNVGIGTADPQAPLEVAGTLKATTLTGNGAMPWVVVSGTSATASPNTAYMANNAALVTITLPASPAVGDVIRVSGAGSGGWKLLLQSGQSMFSADLGIGFWLARASSKAWSCIAGCAYLTNLVAGISPGPDTLYVSRDAGATWIARGPSINCRGVASSSTGAKMAAAAYNGQLYTSTDYGSNWTARAAARLWNCIASSSDGARLVAGVNNGYLWTSTDSGANWYERTTSGTGPWAAVASSGDGLRLVAAEGGGYVFLSTDAGTNWTQVSTFYCPYSTYTGAASSADGSKLQVCSTGTSGDIYTSANSGTTWMARTFSGSWSSVAISGDGTRRLAAISAATGQIYDITGINTGISDAGHWTAIAVSADGKRVVGVRGDGQIYTYAGAPDSLSGGRGAVLELQHIGGGVFMPLSYLGSVSASY
jgi:hypothetical protein